MRTRQLAGAALAAAVALSVGGCTDGSLGPVGTPEPTSLRIGVPLDQPGVGLRVGSDVIGFDIDVARDLATRLGVAPENVTWVPTTDLTADTLLSTGQADLVIGTGSGQASADRVMFVGPYLLVRQDLLVPAAATAVSGPRSLIGKEVCVVSGSGADSTIRDDYPGVQLRELSGYPSCVAALLAGSVDAVAGSDAVLAGLANQAEVAPLVRVLGRPFGTEADGITMANDDATLCERVATALTAMVSDGSWERFFAANLAPLGYHAAAGNPPKPRSTCSS